MRLVPVNCIKEGSYLAKTIYDANGRVLLACGYKLTGMILKKVEQSGVLSLYINDEYSDSVIEDFVKPELRQKAVNIIKESFVGLKKQFEKAADGQSSANKYKEAKLKYQYVDNMIDISSQIVEEIMAQKDILINLVDIKSMDNYTYQHSINVTILSLVLGIELKYDKKRLSELAIGAILHDIGKVFTPKEILQKAGKLTDDEFHIIKEHTTNGYEYIKDIPDLSIPSRNIALRHHEKMDGTGYPEGIEGSKIHDYAKIVAIADVYDALTSDRPYRRAMPPNEAIEYLMGAAQRHFDFKMVSTFIKKIIPYPLGTAVRLSNGEIAVITEINKEFVLRPAVKVVKGRQGLEIDLMEEKNIVIQGMEYNVSL